VDEDPNRKSRPDRDGGCNVEIALDDLLPRAITIGLRGFPQRPDQVRLAIT
jgi:hypothetical protein